MERVLCEGFDTEWEGPLQRFGDRFTVTIDLVEANCEEFGRIAEHDGEF